MDGNCFQLLKMKCVRRGSYCQRSGRRNSAPLVLWLSNLTDQRLMWAGKPLPNLCPLGRSLLCGLPGFWDIVQLLHVQGWGQCSWDRWGSSCDSVCPGSCRLEVDFARLAGATQVDSKAFLASHLVRTCPLKIRW